MHQDGWIMGTLMDESWLTLEQAAAACGVEPAWLLAHVEEGLLPHVECAAGLWQLTSTAILRVRRMHGIEKDFDAVPELAGLMADLLEEMDDLRSRLGDLERP